MFFVARVSQKKISAGVAVWVAVMLLILLYRVVAVVQTVADVDSKESVALPIIMYHGLSLNPAKQGRYVISPDVLESDLKFLKEHGYTTVVMADVIAYVESGTPLPERSVMLTFDDGNYNNYVYAYPLMKKYNSKMVISPIGAAVDRYTQIGNTEVEYATCHWQHLLEMQKSGYVEVQNHSYNLHSVSGRKGVKKKASETIEEYRRILMADVSRMQQRLREELGKEADTFVYPFGSYSKESEDILREMGFRATVNCESRVNKITRDAGCLYGLGRYLRTGSPDAAAFFAKILPGLS